MGGFTICPLIKASIGPQSVHGPLIKTSISGFTVLVMVVLQIGGNGGISDGGGFRSVASPICSDRWWLWIWMMLMMIRNERDLSE
ncbi:unnamed protein product [Camellia sinensis]